MFSPLLSYRICTNIAILMKTLVPSLFVAAFLALVSLDAEAQGSQFLDVSVAGWNASQAFGSPSNSGTTITIDAERIVVGFDWIDLQYGASGFNWMSDLVISVSGYSGDTGNFEWLEWSPSTIDFPGTYGPSSGSWGGADGKPGPYSEGGAFLPRFGSVFVTVYNAYPQGDALELQSGVLRIHLAPVPEPASWAMMITGFFGLGTVLRASRKRQQVAA